MDETFSDDDAMMFEELSSSKEISYAEELVQDSTCRLDSLQKHLLRYDLKELANDVEEIRKQLTSVGARSRVALREFYGKYDVFKCENCGDEQKGQKALATHICSNRNRIARSNSSTQTGDIGLTAVLQASDGCSTSPKPQSPFSSGQAARVAMGKGRKGIGALTTENKYAHNATSFRQISDITNISFRHSGAFVPSTPGRPNVNIGCVFGEEYDPQGGSASGDQPTCSSYSYPIQMRKPTQSFNQRATETFGGAKVVATGFKTGSGKTVSVREESAKVVPETTDDTMAFMKSMFVKPNV